MTTTLLAYTLIRSRRKTVALIVQGSGSLVVRAPLRLARRTIDQFVASKAEWIDKHRQAVKAHPEAPPAHRYAASELFWFLGQRYPLEIVPSTAAPLLELKDGKFRLAARAVPRAAAVFETWYRRQARLVLSERVALRAAFHMLTVSGLRISSARTRWGSCSSRGSLSFTWRLVLAPMEVVDYVIVHELAHLQVHNHSPAFWKEVASLMPDYAPRKQWLKLNGRILI